MVPSRKHESNYKQAKIEFLSKVLSYKHKPSSYMRLPTLHICPASTQVREANLYMNNHVAPYIFPVHSQAHFC